MLASGFWWLNGDLGLYVAMLRLLPAVCVALAAVWGRLHSCICWRISKQLNCISLHSIHAILYRLIPDETLPTLLEIFALFALFYFYLARWLLGCTQHVGIGYLRRNWLHCQRNRSLFPIQRNRDLFPIGNLSTATCAR
jgi:hypothetical protein